MDGNRTGIFAVEVSELGDAGDLDLELVDLVIEVDGEGCVADDLVAGVCPRDRSGLSSTFHIHKDSRKKYACF